MTEPAFYFALPRLLAAWGGGSAARTETNWVEANVVGAFAHGIVYLFAFQVLVAGLSPVAQVLLLLPVVFVVWVFWVVFFYSTSLLIRAGLLRHLPRARAQSILVGTLATCLSMGLIGGGTWMKWIGLIWLTGVSLNLVAAALLCVLFSDARA